MIDSLLLNLNILFDSNFLKLFIISMVPITELRFSIPYGIIILNVNIFTVMLSSIIGNIFIGVIIIYLLAPLMKFLRRYRYIDKVILKIFNRTRSKGKIIKRLKFFGLILFIGIPLPLTGVWTGSLAAYLFDLSRYKSILAIILGVLISSFIVLSLSIFTDGFFQL